MGEEMIKKDEQIKKLIEERKQLKRDVLYWKEECQSERRETSRLKTWIEHKFKWWAELVANEKSPNLKWLINDTAKVLKYWD